MFVHVPKTGGTSLTRLLSGAGSARHELCAPRTKHETLQLFDRRIGLERVSDYKIFAVVRHPLERLVSHFRYLKSNPHQFPEMAAVSTLEDYVQAISEGDMNILRRPERYMPQHEWVTLEGGAVRATVFKYEDCGPDFLKILDFLKLRPSKAPMLNMSAFDRPAVSSDVREFVDRFYRTDFELFGY